MNHNQQQSLKRNFTFIFFVKWLGIALVTGILVGTASAGFLQSLDWVTHLRETHKWFIALLPVAGLLIGLMYHTWGKDVESGNNLLLDALQTSEQRIPFRMAPFVYVGTIITHLFGGSAGREGTAVQMAGAIADQFTKPCGLTNEERKVLIITAIAAGFGSVFGTPFAGAMFGLEVFFVGRIRYKAIFPAVAASFIADFVTQLWHTNHTLYPMPSIPVISFLNLLYVIVSGIIFGLCAAMFCKAQHGARSWFASKITYPPLRPFIGGCLVAALVFIIGSTKYSGLGIPSLLEAFQQPLPACDFVLKMVFTILTLAAGFKGGEVTPLFFIGATLGNTLGYFIPLPFEFLAGMGFVAVFAGAANVPITCSIMAIELFGVESGVFVSVACVVAFLMSGNNSIYTSQLTGQHTYFKFKPIKGW